MTPAPEPYRDALLDDVLPFWLTQSMDRECGGFFTSLARDGSVYDTDKWMWLQARQTWTFAMLCNILGPHDEWAEAARHGADFLRTHGQAPGGDWYFRLDRAGRPLVQPYNIFADCFAAMALAQVAIATGDDAAGNLARQTWRRILERRDNPKGQWSKNVPATRPLHGFALPMILANLALEVEHLLDPAEVEATLDGCVHLVMDVFIDRDLGVTRENVRPDGSFDDSFEGRQVNPGHGLEAMWFIMAIGERRGDQAFIERAAAMVPSLLDFGWDPEHGGIFYFLDALGKPRCELEWDQKLWWVHLEALVALLMAWRLTGRDDCRAWYDRVHDWTWEHFPDPEYGEWFGYLNRRGEPCLTVKGAPFKGCFHVPRALLRCWQEAEKVQALENN